MQLISRYRGFAARVVAEILIIVVGVTIALWADSWVTERNERAVEVTRLTALQENIAGTLGELRDAQDDAKAVVEAMRTLLTTPQSGHSDAELQRLLRYGLLYGPDFYPEINVYDDLKNSGDLALLTNTELRQLLASMNSRLEIVENSQADMIVVQQLNVDPFLIGQIDLDALIGSSLGLEYNVPGDGMNYDFLRQEDFRNLLIFKLDLVVQLELVFQDAEKALVDVQDAIARQLADSGR